MIYKIPIVRLVTTSEIDGVGGGNRLEGLIREYVFYYGKRRQYMQSVLEASGS